MSDFKLIKGDCLVEMSNIEDKSIDMILCDLPYNQTKNEWDTIIPFDRLWAHYERILKENGVAVLFGQGIFTAQAMLSNKKMWRYNLIWNKEMVTGFLNAKKNAVTIARGSDGFLQEATYVQSADVKGKATAWKRLVIQEQEADKQLLR